MKRLLLLLITIISLTALSAQVTLKNDKYHLVHNGIASDTVGSVVETFNYPIFVNKGFGFFYQNAVKVAEVTSNFKCRIILQGKVRSSESYAGIDTITYYGTAADSTVLFSNVATKTNYNYINYLIERISGKGRVVYLDLNIKKY